MSLEDFFTLAEFKNGIMSPSRVAELVSVMQKESSCVVHNFAEVARQWSAVSSVLAATENKDSLDEFIKLDGIQFLNNWLHKALNCGDSTSDCSVEESIIALLGALVKLPIVQECSFSSVIMGSVKDLCGHKSYRVQDKARALFDSWNQGRDTDIDHSNVDKKWILCDKESSASAKVVAESGTPEDSSDGTSLIKENGNGDVHAQECAGAEYPQSIILDASNPEIIQDGKISTADNHDTSCKTLISADKDNGPQNSKENFSIESEFSIRSAEGTASTDVLSVPVVREADPYSLTLVSVKESTVPDHIGADNSDSSQGRISDSDLDVVASKVEHEMVDSNGTNYSENQVMHEPTTTREGGDNCCNVLPDLVNDGDILRKVENSESSSCKMEDTGLVGNASGIIMKSLLTADVLEPVDVTIDSSKINRSDSKVYYGISNAQEVSGQVSNKSEQKGGLHTDSSYHGDGEPLYGVKPKEILSDGALPQKGDEQLCSKDCIQDTLATESAQGTSNSGKGVLDIDLNEEVYHEGVDCLNTSISNIAASGTPDGYGIVSVEESFYSSKQRPHLFEIDLNMTECLDGAADTVLTDQIPASSCLISGESSIEVNSRIEGKHNLDLNSVGDHGDSPSSDELVGKSCHHYLHNPTPAASSSSREPLSTDFDLNENLCFANDTYDQQIDLQNLSSHGMNSCGELKQDNGAICIMGKRVEFNRNYSTPSQSIFPNVQSGISFMSNSLQLGSVGLQHAMASMPQPYGATVMGPSTSLSDVCEQGYIPYMVDSRGVHVTPQIVGSPMALPPHPFPMSLNSTPCNVNGVGSSKASFDLNSSSMTMEGWTGELGGWKSEQNHLKDSMGLTSLRLSSGLGMKRKEPDDGPELYPYNYKQRQLWL